MANFQKAPITLLQSPPASLKKEVVETLMRPGTYNLFDEKGYSVKVPVGNDTWKGQQARVVALWGEDDAAIHLLLRLLFPSSKSRQSRTNLLASISGDISSRLSLE